MLLMDEFPQLPPEVWVCVFRFLTTEEKHTVRTCCKYLMKLIDHPSLWKDFTVVLSDVRRYNCGFWATLHSRKITRVAVQHLRRREWRRLVKFLPGMTAIVFVNGGKEENKAYKEKYLRDLKKFPQLGELGVRNASWMEPLLGLSLTEQLQDQLTHLSVCNVRLTCAADFIHAVSHLYNLQHLLYHQQGDGFGLPSGVRPVPRSGFHHMLSGLQKLKHLSWGMRGEPAEPLPDDYFSPPGSFQQSGRSQYGGPALTSLELVDYPETLLPENALRSLSSLRCLTIRYKYMREGIECRLKSWLSPLTQLTSLTIIGGNSLGAYTTTIPSSVTRLTLRVAITLKDMDSIAPKVPGLLHLDIEQNRSSGSLCRRIPMLFPQLRTLRIRFFRREPEKDLLSLHRLRHLVQLELLVERSYILRDYLNGHPWPSPGVQELISQLRALSDNRISVITTMRQRNPLRDCDCMWEGD
ncbi:uncharacterized protein LOC115353966 [Myripristis murdjan]|uniref:Uncharacterized LOC115353966 n=1 Tax=Myripristis murdjan TaxID=586833 RepID=A0A667Y562_9TELE|nr:uncharacterized protein LOC115353966 [Myripristis murdjan]